MNGSAAASDASWSALSTTCDGTQYQLRNQKDISTEIRFASNTAGPLQWQLGGYYLHIDRTVGVSLGADLGLGVTQQLYNAPGSNNPTSQLFADKFKTDVFAVFGSTDYKFAERADLGLALRFDSEHRSVDSLVPNVADPITGGPINPGQQFGAIASKSKTFNQVEPKVTLGYEFAPRNNIYANWGIGFKSGGFNNQGSAAIIAQNFDDGVTPGTINADVTINDNYRKEWSSAFEVGVRGRIGPVSYDMAGFYTQVHDMQFFEFFVGSFGLLRVVSNIDRVDLGGAEFNLNSRVAKGVQIFGSFNVTDSKIKANSSRPYTVGNKSPYTADYTLNVGTQIDRPISGDVRFVTRIDYRLTGPTWFHTVQDQTRPTLFSGLLPISALALPGFVGDAKYDVAHRSAYGVLDVRVGVEGKAWKATVFASNLTDEKYLNEVIPAIEFGGSFISPGARRQWGVELGYKF